MPILLLMPHCFVQPAVRRPYHEEFGLQLSNGPLLLDIGGNPLGFAGLRQVLQSLDWMTMVLEDAALDAKGERRGGQGAVLGAKVQG